jgi:hypothetical protein
MQNTKLNILHENTRCMSNVPHADDNRIGPCRVQQQRRSKAQQEQQEIQGPTTLIMGSDHGSTL